MRVRWLMVVALGLGACGGGHAPSTVSVTTTSSDTASTDTTQQAALPTMPPLETSAPAPSTSTTTRRVSVTTAAAPTTTSTTAASSLVAQGGTADLHLTLTVSPSAPRRGQVVDYVIDATDTQSRGALNRSLDFGDGQQAPAAATPQFCTGQPQSQQQRWEFQHTYGSDGKFVVVARVSRVCGQGSATAQLTLVVNG
jgi:hypothetical protein